MKLGILSDTHGWYHPALDEAFKDVDLIVHAGDVGAVDIIDRLQLLAPTRAVYGNVDGFDVRAVAPEVQDFEVEGLRFLMIHIGGRPGRWERGVGDLLKTRRPGVFICGHSHILRIERDPRHGGMLFVNPGAAGRQGLHREKTCVRLEIAEGKASRAEVVHLDG